MGITQGITEFLPVSSTAHLNLLSRQLRQKPDLAVDTALHLGSLGATLLWIWRCRQSLPLKEPRFWGKWALSTLPAGLAGLCFEKQIKRWRRPALTAGLLSGGGLALLWTYYRTHHQTPLPLKELSYGQALGIGFAQALALLPGLSRSGMTQMAGQWYGLSGEEAQRFSFLMALPIVSASAAFEMRDLRQDTLSNLLPGLVTAGLSSHLMLKHVSYFSAGPPYQALGVYRVLLGAYLLKNTASSTS